VVQSKFGEGRGRGRGRGVWPAVPFTIFTILVTVPRWAVSPLPYVATSFKMATSDEANIGGGLFVWFVYLPPGA